MRSTKARQSSADPSDAIFAETLRIASVPASGRISATNRGPFSLPLMSLATAASRGGAGRRQPKASPSPLFRIRRCET